MRRRAFLSGLVAVLVAPLPERQRVYSFPSEPTIWTPPEPGFWLTNSQVGRLGDYGIDLSDISKSPVGTVSTFHLPDGRRCVARCVGAEMSVLTYNVTIEPRLENIVITGGVSV